MSDRPAIGAPGDGPIRFEEELRAKLKQAVALKDYAVTSSLALSEGLLEKFADLQRQADTGSLSERAAELDQAILELSACTAPMTVDSIVAEGTGESQSYQKFKGLLMGLGLVGVAFAIVSAQLSYGGKYGTMLPQSAFSVALGFLGAVVYSFFVALRIIPRSFSVDDRYSNYARLVLGSILGWIVYFAFLTDTFDVAFMVVRGGGGPTPTTDDPSKARVLLLTPFLVGYSTTLAVGILNKAITAVEITLGLEDRRDRIFKRGGGGTDPPSGRRHRD